MSTPTKSLAHAKVFNERRAMKAVNHSIRLFKELYSRP